MFKFALTKLLVNMDKQESKANKDTEQLILEAAVREFSTKGFDGARTSAIAAEAGVTHAMLHYYFRTKEKLFERIFQEKLGYIINMVLAPLAESSGDIRERIRNGIGAHIDFLKENRELPIFFVTTINSRPEVYGDVIANLSASASARMDAFQRELDAAHARGEIAQVDARALVGDVACLNVFPFLANPLMMAVMGYADFDDYIEARKKENVEIIMKRIS